MKLCVCAVILVVALGLSGCVTKENYNAQVLRTNNFQRLLAEEEKRAVELSAESAKLKEQIVSLESKNQALTAQFNEANAKVVQSLEEVGRLQDDLSEARATATVLSGLRSASPLVRLPAPTRPSNAQVSVTRAPSVSSTFSTEPPDRLDELQSGPASHKRALASARVAVGTSFLYHDVKKGETLIGLAKRYHTTTQALREFNDMAVGDAVRPGDRLIVGEKP